MIKFAGHVERIGEMINAYKVLVDKPEGNRPIGKSKRRWEDNIKLHLKETGWEGVDLIHVGEHWDEWRDFVKR